MSELIVSRQQQVLLLTLNRPAARNALNNALLTQLVNELEAAATDSSISVCVITGNCKCWMKATLLHLKDEILRHLILP